MSLCHCFARMMSLSQNKCGPHQGEFESHGFTHEDCEPIWGDHVSCIVKWKTGDDVSALAGQAVRLRVEMSDADLFSIRFAE